ncbi:MAG: hypothetical protein JNN29_14785 [Chitinophagaceae bacterium]|nr:hypothetical protein [Chitinophagaceae bacterium]MBN8668435.1 hypothetical protein [Chitinophagales bacterium]
MKRKGLLSLMLCLLLAGVNAQSGFTFGVGVNAALPTGVISNASSFVIGAEAQGEFGFNDQVSGIVTAGYAHFLEKNNSGLNFGAVPLLAGARYNATENFFVGAQVGYGFFTGNANGGGFAYKPQVGFKTGSVQITGSYNAISNNGTIGWAGVSAVFTFGK